MCVCLYLNAIVILKVFIDMRVEKIVCKRVGFLYGARTTFLLNECIFFLNKKFYGFKPFRRWPTWNV